ncbi:MAG: phosphotransferase [Candidatus Hodarchaeales archaeon]|jgi:hypothetical protein
MVQDSYKERMQKVLISIIEGFSDYFVSCLQKTYHETPNKIDVKNIVVERKLGTTGIHIVKVSLDSDLGQDEASIAVKIYNENEQALDVVKRINALDKIISDYSHLGISTAGVIFFSSGVVIMEGIQGNDFRGSKIPKPQKYRYAGRSLAAFHGIKSNRCWFDKYKLLLSRTIENIPASVEIKQNLRYLFDKVIPLVEQSSQFSGTVSFGDFHPGNLIFDIRIGRNPMIHSYIIDPEYLETSTEHDRLEDICNFFAVEAVDQYRHDRNLTNFRMNMKSFFSGYSEFLAYEQSSLEKFYTGSYTPVNFHLALMILMSVLNIQNMTDIFGGESGLQQEMNLRFELIQKLLEWKSFPD